MPLIECPECRKGVSDKAAACTHCGHPIAGYGDYDPTAAERAQRLLRNEPTSESPPEQKKSNPGCGVVVVLMLIGIVGLIAIGSYQEAGNKANPTCKSDWRLCSDNADLINHYDDISSGKAYCEVEAKALAKYGSPKFPFLPFGSFYRGDAYVRTGVVTFIEKDAQFSNAFGAMVHSTVTCRYDLSQKKVLDTSVAPN
jgi:hypothetical protein